MTVFLMSVLRTYGNFLLGQKSVGVYHGAGVAGRAANSGGPGGPPGLLRIYAEHSKKSDPVVI